MEELNPSEEMINYVFPGPIPICRRVDENQRPHLKLQENKDIKDHMSQVASDFKEKFVEIKTPQTISFNGKDIDIFLLQRMDKGAVRLKIEDLLKKKKYKLQLRSSNHTFFSTEYRRFVLRRAQKSASASDVKLIKLCLKDVLKGLDEKFVVSPATIKYTNKPEFLKEDVPTIDETLKDTMCLVGCPKIDMNLAFPSMGLFVGLVEIKSRGGGLTTDPSEFKTTPGWNVDGVKVPKDMNSIVSIKCHPDVSFILIVEHSGIFDELAARRCYRQGDDVIEAAFWEQHPSIVVLSGGYGDIQTRLFVTKLQTELKLPVLAAVDHNPNGIEILSTYMYGSKNLSHECDDMITSWVYMLGLKRSQIDNHGIKKEWLIPEKRLLNAQNNKRKRKKKNDDVRETRSTYNGKARDLIDAAYMDLNMDLKAEVQFMINKRQYAELECLRHLDDTVVGLGHNYTINLFLPFELQSFTLSNI